MSTEKQFGVIGNVPTQSFNDLPRKYNPIKAEIPISISYLVIAGGGGGSASSAGGAGGAGGFRTNAGTSGGGASSESALSIKKGTTFSVEAPLKASIRSVELEKEPVPSVRGECLI